MLKIAKAYGTIGLIDGTIIECKGATPFDLLTIPDMNDITELITDEFMLELDNGNTITFPDAQNIRLFMGHNKMLNEKAEQEKLEIEDEIAGYEYQLTLITNDPAMKDFYLVSIDQLKCRMANI